MDDLREEKRREEKRRAKEIIEKISYLVLGTVSPDGQPLVTPVATAYDDHYHFFFASDKNGHHARYIQENEKVCWVIFDSTAPEGTGEGVYFEGRAEKLEKEEDILYAQTYLTGRYNHKPHDAKEFLGDFPRRIYKLVPQKVWMNGDGDVNGNYIDIRIEIPLLED